jgi:PAP2 superfamily
MSSHRSLGRLIRTGSALFALLLTIALSGCATSGSREWGSEVSWVPPMARLRSAAGEAAKDPRVWIPLAAAALFQIDGLDRKVSNHARDDTPVFGSQRAAQDWSDRLRTASSVAYFATVLATPAPEEPGPWIRDKAQGVVVGLGAVAVTGLATSTLKSATGRTRPNGQGTNSFPSGHVSHSAVLTGLARDNLEDMDLSAGTRRALDLGLDALTAGTAWARIEAGAHFPSDTLFSVALGNFVSRFFDRSFLEPDHGPRSALNVVPLRHGVELQWELRY